MADRCSQALKECFLPLSIMSLCRSAAAGSLGAHPVQPYYVLDSCVLSPPPQVDGDPVPVPHFGAALTVEQFQQLAQRLRAAGVKFVIEPHLRFPGQPGEQVRGITWALRHPGGGGGCMGRVGGGGGGIGRSALGGGVLQAGQR